MKHATLLRLSDDGTQTLGFIVFGANEAKTLELAWKDNATGISCIPQGTYECVWSESGGLSKIAGKSIWTYEVLGVPGRNGIRIHSANYFFQLRGCVALGSVHKDLNKDMKLDVIHSGKTCETFNKYMNKDPFKLEILKINSI